MVQKRLPFSVVPFLVALSCASIPDTEIPSFFLCAANVQSAQLVQEPFGDRVAIEIRLSPESAEDFESFSEENVGKYVQLFVGDAETTRTVIRAPMRDGLIRLSPNGDGEELLDRLQPPPEGPCGSAA